MDLLIGRTAKRDFEEEDFSYESDLATRLQAPTINTHSGRNGNPCTIPRFNAFDAMIEPDIWEFHLSYGDMSVDFSKLLPEHNNSRLVVHAPELFANSRLMNLAFDEKERAYSIDQTKRVIELTIDLQRRFEGGCQ